MTTFDYREFTGVQIQTKLSTGHIEILTSSFQANKSKSYWSKGKDDDPNKLPNCISDAPGGLRQAAYDPEAPPGWLLRPPPGGHHDLGRHPASARLRQAQAPLTRNYLGEHP